MLFPNDIGEFYERKIDNNKLKIKAPKIMAKII